MDTPIEDIIIAVLENTASLEERLFLDQQRKDSKETEQLYQSYSEMYLDIEKIDLEQPSDNLGTRFQKSLTEAKSSNSIPKTRSFVFRYIAVASIILLAGIGIGSLLNNNSRISEMDAEIAALKSNMNNLLNDESTSARIQAVNLSYELATPDPEILNVLIQTMNNDPSEHVQLSAIDALGNFASTPIVKNELIKALENKRSPYVQIKLIKILSNIKAKGALPAIDNIIDGDGAQRRVLKEAILGKERITSI